MLLSSADNIIYEHYKSDYLVVTNYFVNKCMVIPFLTLFVNNVYFYIFPFTYWNFGFQLLSFFVYESVKFLKKFVL